MGAARQGQRRRAGVSLRAQYALIGLRLRAVAVVVAGLGFSAAGFTVSLGSGAGARETLS